jgi:outer membrane immunogenic protein
MARLKSILLATAVASATAFASTANAGPWDGWYIGLNAGGGWGNGDVTYSGDGGGGGDRLLNSSLGGISSLAANTYTTAHDTSGFTGGAQLGFNWTSGSWLFGVETDIQYSDLSDTFQAGSDAAPHAIFLDAERSLDWFGTLRARFGVMASPSMLLYATGGLAYGGTDQTATLSRSATFAAFATGGTTPLTCQSGVPCISDSASSTAAGWALGGGLEFALGSMTTLRGEYLHVDLGEESVRMVAVAPSTGTGFATAEFDNTYDVVRVGLNFKF